MFVKLACIPNFSFLGTGNILARGGVGGVVGWVGGVGLTLIIRPVSVPNWTGTELDLNCAWQLSHIDSRTDIVQKCIGTKCCQQKCHDHLFGKII